MRLVCLLGDLLPKPVTKQIFIVHLTPFITSERELEDQFMKDSLQRRIGLRHCQEFVVFTDLNGKCCKSIKYE